MDNASTKDVLFMHTVRALLTLYDIPEQPDKQIRCLAHILNLVAQAILGALKEVDDCVEDGDESDHFFQHKNAPVHFTLDEDEDLHELEGNRENDLLVNGGKNGAADAVEKKLKEEEVNELASSTALSRVSLLSVTVTVLTIRHTSSALLPQKLSLPLNDVNAGGRSQQMSTGIVELTRTTPTVRSYAHSCPHEMSVLAGTRPME
jgi:hypothetical protein